MSGEIKYPVRVSVKRDGTRKWEEGERLSELASADGSTALVEKLLDAAFRELQHDTGEHDVEWQHQRKVLRAAFKKILRVR